MTPIYIVLKQNALVVLMVKAFISSRRHLMDKQAMPHCHRGREIFDT